MGKRPILESLYKWLSGKDYEKFAKELTDALKSIGVVESEDEVKAFLLMLKLELADCILYEGFGKDEEGTFSSAKYLIAGLLQDMIIGATAEEFEDGSAALNIYTDRPVSDELIRQLGNLLSLIGISSVIKRDEVKAYVLRFEMKKK